LAGLRVLPYEGATDGRHLHRVAHIAQALDAMRAGDHRGALALVEAARQWPERLGAGKPYPADVDESIEDAIQWRVLTRAGRAADARGPLARLRTASPARTGAGRLAAALALRDAGLREEAGAVLANWANDETDSALADWGRGVFAGVPVALPRSVAGTDLYALVDRLATAR
jgi:hypothetical protein